MSSGNSFFAYVALIPYPSLRSHFRPAAAGPVQSEVDRISEEADIKTGWGRTNDERSRDVGHGSLWSTHRYPVDKVRIRYISRDPNHCPDDLADVFVISAEDETTKKRFEACTTKVECLGQRTVVLFIRRDNLASPHVKMLVVGTYSTRIFSINVTKLK